MNKLLALFLLVFTACGPAAKHDEASEGNAHGDTTAIEGESADTALGMPASSGLGEADTSAGYQWNIAAPEDSIKQLYEAVVAFQAGEPNPPALLQRVDTTELKQAIAQEGSSEAIAMKYYDQTVRKLDIQEGMPSKLSYVAWSKLLYSGDELPVQVQLQDSRNQLVRGNKAFKVDVNVQGMDTEFSKTDTITIGEGESMGYLTVRLGNAGIYRITCSNFEMQPAEWFVKVLPVEKKKMNYTPRGGSPVFRFAQTPKAVLMGFVQTERKVRANGNDIATVTYFLQDPDNVIPDTDSVKVLLSTNEAHLDHLHFWISESKEKRVSLTATSPGIIRVTANCISPRVQIDKPFYEVKFYAAVERYQMRASPSIVNLLEKSNIAVQLVNAAGEPIGTDEEMEASFYIESKSGTGMLDPDLAKILIGNFEGRVIFLPTGTGELNLQAYVKTLPIQPPILLKIVWPLKVTLMTMIGGLIGAFISHLVKKKKKLIITLGIGAVMGFVFFWIMVYAGTAKLSHAIVLNQLSVVVFGIAGGWLGTDVMKLLLKQVKVEL